MFKPTLAVLACLIRIPVPCRLMPSSTELPIVASENALKFSEAAAGGIAALLPGCTLLMHPALVRASTPPRRLPLVALGAVTGSAGAVCPRQSILVSAFEDHRGLPSWLLSEIHGTGSLGARRALWLIDVTPTRRTLPFFGCLWEDPAVVPGEIKP